MPLTRWLGHEGEAMVLVPLQEGHGCHVRVQQEGSLSEPTRGSFSVGPYQHPDLRLPDLRTVKNKCVVDKPSAYGNLS